MDNFEERKSKQNETRLPVSSNEDADNVVDIAIARMKSGAVVKEERKSRAKFVVIGALILTGLIAFSQLDFVYKTPSSETAANGDTIVTLKQDHQGHYMAKGAINGQAVNFLVDTGATDVAIPLSVAEDLGLPLGRKFSTMTANGKGTAYETGIDTITLGDITLTGIDASVTDGLVGDRILLGMSFLRKMRIEQDNGVMKIIY